MEGMDPHPKAISCRSFLFCRQQTQGNNTPLLPFPARAFSSRVSELLILKQTLSTFPLTPGHAFKSRALQET